MSCLVPSIVIVIERGSWGNDITHTCWARLRHDVPDWARRTDNRSVVFVEVRGAQPRGAIIFLFITAYFWFIKC